MVAFKFDAFLLYFAQCIAHSLTPRLIIVDTPLFPGVVTSISWNTFSLALAKAAEIWIVLKLPTYLPGEQASQFAEDDNLHTSVVT